MIKNFLLLTLLIFTFISCTDLLDEKDRLNPLDEAGDNYYPPVAWFLRDTIDGKFGNNVDVKVYIYDKNSDIDSLKYYLAGDSLFYSEAINVDYLDTLNKYDSTVVLDTLSFTKIKSYDSLVYADSVLAYSFKGYSDTVETYLTYLDSLNDTVFDTLIHVEDGDTIYVKDVSDTLNKMFYLKYAVYDSTPVLDTLDPVLDSTYYLYSSSLLFKASDTFNLFLKAVDSDGLESENSDSVLVQIGY